VRITKGEEASLKCSKQVEKPAGGVGDRPVEVPPEKQLHKPADAAGKPREMVPDKLDAKQEGIKDAEVIGKSKEHLSGGDTSATKKETLEVLEKVPPNHQ